jgi:hypothetical protein
VANAGEVVSYYLDKLPRWTWEREQTLLLPLTTGRLAEQAILRVPLKV